METVEVEDRRPEMAWTHLLGRAREQPRRVLACAVAGQLAGLTFLGFLIFVQTAFMHDRPFDWPVRVVAAFLLGERALLDPNGLTYVLGILVNQLLPAFGWSMFYAWIVMSPRFPLRVSTCMTLGFGVGLAAMWFDVYFIVPPGMVVLHDQDFWWLHIPRIWDWAAHIVFGLALGWFFLIFSPRIERTPRYEGTYGRS